MITIYQKGTAFRVVRGEHSPNTDVMHNATVRTYADAADAFETETDNRIREAIALIDPSVRTTAAARIAPVRTSAATVESDADAYLRDVARELAEQIASEVGDARTVVQTYTVHTQQAALACALAERIATREEVQS